MILFVIHDHISLRSSLPLIAEISQRQLPFRICTISDIPLPTSLHSQSMSLESASLIHWTAIVANGPINRSALKGKLISYYHGSMFGNSSWTLRRAADSDIYCGLTEYEKIYIRHNLGSKFTAKLFATGATHHDNYRKLNALSPQKLEDYKISLRQKLGVSPKQKIFILTSHWTSTGN